jgi:hypothetical protein
MQSYRDQEERGVQVDHVTLNRVGRQVRATDCLPRLPSESSN